MLCSSVLLKHSCVGSCDPSRVLFHFCSYRLRMAWMLRFASCGSARVCVWVCVSVCAVLEASCNARRLGCEIPKRKLSHFSLILVFSLRLLVFQSCRYHGCVLKRLQLLVESVWGCFALRIVFIL